MRIGAIQINKFHKRVIWLACLDCGRPRWVRILEGKPASIYCHHCSVRRRGWSVVIAYPLRSDKEAYIKSYGEDLESRFDNTNHSVYRKRIFCRDCPDFETCRGSLWKHCPIRAEVLEMIKEKV